MSLPKLRLTLHNHGLLCDTAHADSVMRTQECSKLTLFPPAINQRLLRTSLSESPTADN